MMSNNIIVLSSDDDEGDSPTDHWASYASKAVEYTAVKTAPPPQSAMANDPFQIGYSYATPLKVTPHKGDQLSHVKLPICDNISDVEGSKATSPTARPYRHATICGEEGQCATSSSSLITTEINSNKQSNKGDKSKHAKSPICDNSSVMEGLKTTSPIVWPYI